MTSAELDQAATTVDGLGLAKMLDRLTTGRADDAKAKIERSKVDPLIALGLITYKRGVARATDRGYSVATRLIVRREQRAFAARGPGWWRTP